MNNWQAAPAVTGQGFLLPLGEAVAFWKMGGALKQLLLGAAVDKLLRDAARQAGITIGVEELQAGADRFRAARGLHSAEQTRAWLGQNGLSVEDLEAGVERSLITEKLMARIPAPRVQARFEKERDQFARVRLRHITLPSEGAAHELLARLREEGADFADLAREFSLDPATRANGGDLGVVQRRQLPADLAGPVFAGAPGQVVGPLTTAGGVHLFRIDEFRPAELDAATDRHIRQHIFSVALQREINARQFTFPLLDKG